MEYTNQFLPLGIFIFSGIANLVVGIYIYLFVYKLSNKSYISARYLSCICFSIFNWTFWIALNNLYILPLGNQLLIYLASVFIYISFISIIQALIFFAISFANNIKSKNKYKFLHYIYILVALFIILPELIVASLSSNINSIEYNWLSIYIIICYTLSYYILYLKILLDKYKVVSNKNIKINIILFLTLPTLSIIFILMTNILSPFLYQNFGLTYLGPVFSLLIMISILISILKYKLFYIQHSVSILLITFIITLILLTIRFSTIDNSILIQSQFTLLFIFMFSCLYIFLTKEFYVGFKKQLLLDSKKKELEIALDSKNSFLKNSSHQFRTPLTVILGYLGMIINKEDPRYKLNKLALEDLNKTYISAKNLNEIINDLLAVNDVSTGKFGVSIRDNVNLEKLIELIISDKQELLSSKSTKVNFRVKGQTLTATVDHSKIKEAINNIFDNAVFYGKGKIDILLDFRPKDFFEISIKDNGVGITASDAKRIWGKFERGKRSSQINPNGSGLGLYLAREIIVKHGGDILLYSEGLNKGSKFTLKIPKYPVITANNSNSHLTQSSNKKKL